MKSGDRFPVEWHCLVKGTRLEHFVSGRGRIKEPLKDFVCQIIPDLPENYTYDQLRTYKQTWGFACAFEALPHNADAWRAGEIGIACDPKRPDDAFFAWFNQTFRRPLRSFCASLPFVFGHFSFDVFEFERFLADEHGCNIRGEDGIFWFVGQQFSKDIATKLADNLFSSSVSSKSTNNRTAGPHN